MKGYADFSRREFLQQCSLTAAALFTAQLPGTHDLLSTAKIKSVPTLTGSITRQTIGRTLMHEHILFFNGTAPDDRGYQPIPEELKERSIEFAAKMLNDAARVGINTLVDVGPHRPIELYQQIAKKTSVNIVVSTGFYRETKLPPWFSTNGDARKIEDYILKEVQDGIGETSIKAGIIKVAQQHSPMSDWEKRVFTAAAKVQKKTGVHIVTHTGKAVEQFDLLVANGADPTKIFFSHVDVGRKGQAGDLIKLLKGGSYLEVDTFGQNFYTPEAQLMSFIRNVCDSGYSRQLFVSVDSNWHWANGEIKFEGSEAPQLDPTANDRTFAYMMTNAVPSLLKSGFSQKEIDLFLIDNPRKFFFH